MPEAAVAAAYVAAGSNVRPRTNLRAAVAALAAAFPGLRTSRAYANAATGFVGDDFINLVVAFDTDEPLEQLRERLKSIERACGRRPGGPKWGPRTLDLDLLLYGNHVGCIPGGELPRRDVVERAYVLGPLAELAPALKHPVLGETFGELWRRFDRSSHALREVSLEGED